MLFTRAGNRKSSIKAKITATVFLTVSVLVIATSWTLFSYFTTLLRESIFKQQFALVSEIAEQLNGRLELARLQLSLAATEINENSLASPSKLMQILTNASPASLIFDAGFLVIGTDGSVIAESMGLPQLTDYNLSVSEYVQRALKSGTPVISAPFQLSIPPNSPMIALAVPVRDNHDRIICLLAGYHSLGTNQFLTSLSSRRFSTGSYLYLMDGRTILMHPDSSRIMETIPEGRNRGIDRALKGFEGSLDNINSKNQHMLTSFKKVGESGWILAANTPYDEAFMPLTQLAKNALIIISIGIIVSLAVVWLVTRSLTLPIVHLTDRLLKDTALIGDWEPLEIAADDEVGRLPTTFNILMSEVRSARKTLSYENVFFGGIIRNSAAPLFVIDTNHTILFWNNALAKLTGRSSSEMENTTLQWAPFYDSERPVLADLVIDKKLQNIESFYTNYESSLFVAGAYQAEGWYEHIGGKRRYLFFEAVPVLDGNNEIIAAVETLEDITDRKLAQEATASHNLFLQNILDAIPNPVFYKDTNGAYIGSNKSFQAFVGMEFDELVGKTVYDIMPGTYAAETEQHDKELLTKKTGCSYESTLRRYDGQERHALITKAPFFSSSGELLGIIGAFIDLTEQQQLNEQLRKMSRALEQSPASVVITDTEGIIEYVNPKFCQTSGYSAKEAIGRNPRILKSGEMADEGYTGLWQTISSGKEWRGEFHNKRKNGTLFWEFASISPLINTDGRVTGYLAVKEDITARKAAEAELAQSRLETETKHVELQKLFKRVEYAKLEWEQTLDHLRDFVILTDSEHRIRRCNNPLSSITGIPVSDLIGLDWRELIHDAGFEFTTFDGTAGEVHFPKTERLYDIALYPIRDAGKTTGHVVSLHDTTELHAATRELEKAYAGLKEAQLQIFQQEKMASIGQLAAGVAHEINNPMGFISSNLSTLNKYIDRLAEFISAGDKCLLSYPESDEAEHLKETRKRLKIDYVIEDSRQLIAESQDGAGRVRRIVQDLKSFSRVDQTESALINLNDALETTINIAWNEIKYVATLNREFGDIPPIKCHPQQLNQVFLNLLVNASHAMDGVQGTITVSTRCENDVVFVSVADTGCGIPEEIQQRIFEPFFTTKEVGKGTGLGLSISYDIVRKHGGELSVVSEPGKGSTFTVQLPLHPQPCVKEVLK
ncbi:MAG: PAS domain S-box protein [Desulfuromonadaceae bacterium]|nr:PAS domain S-box protein [Desulfuromonadaceae bacterium]